MIFDVQIFEPTGHTIEKSLYVKSDSNVWDDVKAIIYRHFPEYEGRNMSAGSLSAAMVKQFNITDFIE